MWAYAKATGTSVKGLTKFGIIQSSIKIVTGYNTGDRFFFKKKNPSTAMPP